MTSPHSSSVAREGWAPPDLSGSVALVAGATRGAGRAIAIALGQCGATVYCTGRSVAGAPGIPGRPETIHETAELVTASGGRGIAVRVDHTDVGQVRELLERVRAESGRLDILVNDIWGANHLMQWGPPFWETDVEKGLRILSLGVGTHLITAHLAAPLLLESKGILVEVTDGTSEMNREYRGHLYYDLAKVSVNRIAMAMAEELRPRGVTCVAVTPGFLRSEEMLDIFGVTEATWREAIKKDPHFAESETPAFVARAIACLVADPHRIDRSGGVYSSWDLAKEYGFRDVDGRQPDWGRAYAEFLAKAEAPA